MTIVTDTIPAARANGRAGHRAIPSIAASETCLETGRGLE
jgi:hypothetical protein